MSEQAPNAHQKIAGQIEAAAATLPSEAVTVDHDFEGQVRVTGRSIDDKTGYAAHVQLSKESSSPDIALGSAEIGGSVREGQTLGAYGFRSNEEKQGVEAAAIRRMLQPGRDGITRAGSPNHVTRQDGASMLYEHKFSPAARDKAGELITSMVISRAERHGNDVEQLRKAA